MDLEELPLEFVVTLCHARTPLHGLSSRLPVPDLFGGWNPSLEDIERILWTQSEPSPSQLPNDLSKPTSTAASSTHPPTHSGAAESADPQRPHIAANPLLTPTTASANPSTPTAALHYSSPPSGAQALMDTSSVPTLSDVNELIVTQVASQWQKFALMLGVKDFLIDTVSKNHPNDCEGACRAC